MNARFLEIEITGKCHHHCLHCYGSFPRKGELSKIKVMQVLDEVHDSYRGKTSAYKQLLHSIEQAQDRCAGEHFQRFFKRNNREGASSITKCNTSDEMVS